MTRRWRAAVRTITAVAAAVTLGSCAEKGALPTQASSSLVGIVLVANVASQTTATYQVDIKVGYNRTSGESVTLTEQKLSVAGGEQQIPITVDLAPCLADLNRGGARDSCPLMVGITLLDANGSVLDTQSQGPLIASPGKAAVSVGATLNSHFTLSVVTAGAGSGTVQLNPVGNVTATSGSYVPHTSVTLTAVAGASSAFAGWSGDCTGSGTTCVVTMDANKNVIATFNPRYTLTVTTTGSGSGSVTANPAGPAYAPGTSVTLTATPASGSSFSGWSGACSGSGTTCTLTMDANKSVTATFALVTYTLTLGTTGTGSGTVSANPPGPIYAAGTVVSVTATPNPGSTFAGWSGDCTGAGACSVNMSTNRNVTAAFTATAGTGVSQFNGTYAGSMSGNGGTAGALIIVVTNGVLTATVGVAVPVTLTGTVSASGAVTMTTVTLVGCPGVVARFTGQITGAVMAGTWSMPGGGTCFAETGTWTATAAAGTGVSQYNGTYAGTYDAGAGIIIITVTNGVFAGTATEIGSSQFAGTVSVSGAMATTSFTIDGCPGVPAQLTGQITGTVMTGMETNGAGGTCVAGSGSWSATRTTVSQFDGTHAGSLVGTQSNTGGAINRWVRWFPFNVGLDGRRHQLRW